MFYRLRGDCPPTESVRSTSNEGKQVGRITHLWEGTRVIENQYTYICKIVFVNIEFPSDLVTFTEEILNGKLPFLCIASCVQVERDQKIIETVAILW